MNSSRCVLCGETNLLGDLHICAPSMTYKQFMPDSSRLLLIKELQDELTNAQENFPPMNSAHEGWAVLFEEVDELWDVVKLNQKKNPDRNELMRKEAIQVAAMNSFLIWKP